MKKGVVFLWLSLFFAFLAVVVIIVFFLLFAIMSKGANEVIAADSVTTARYGVLTNYLRAPIEFEGKPTTFPDLLRHVWSRTKDPCNPNDAAAIEFQAKTRAFFQQAPISYWYSSVTTEGKRIERKETSTIGLFICTTLPTQGKSVEPQHCSVRLGPGHECRYQGGLGFEHEYAKAEVSVSETGEILYLVS